MNHSDIFDSKYVGGDPQPEKKSEVKKFLKKPIDDEEIKKYGTSKPRRIIIRAKISDGQS